MQDKIELSKKIEELTALRKSIALDLKVIAKSTNIPTQILKNIELQEFAGNLLEQVMARGIEEGNVITREVKDADNS